MEQCAEQQLPNLDSAPRTTKADTLPPSTPQTSPSPYYREPVPGPPHGIPTQLAAPLVRSFGDDHYVEDKGDIVFYKKDPNF